ncbi:MAG: hypothetical protein ACLUHA_13805 [Bacteroides stercoris]
MYPGMRCSPFHHIGYQTVEIKAGGKGLDRIALMEDNNELLDYEVVSRGIWCAEEARRDYCHCQPSCQ